MSAGHRAELGLGTAGLGNLYRPVTDAAAREAVEAALDAGIALFDTAPHYGFGLAERRLGEALAQSDAGRAARVTTKAGRRLVPSAQSGERHGFVDADPFEPVFDYGRDAVLATFDDSLARLQRDRVDTLFVHDLGRRTHGDEDAAHRRVFLEQGYPAMADLKASGAVGRIGLGVNEIAVCLELLAEIDLDAILLAGRYTLLEQGALDELLPLCRARGVAVLVGGPFNSGILAADRAGGRYDYAPAAPEVVARVEILRAVCEGHGTGLRNAALAFPAAHPGVEAVVAGLSSRAEVAEALATWRAPPPPALWTALRSAGLLDPRAPVPSADVLP